MKFFWQNLTDLSKSQRIRTSAFRYSSRGTNQQWYYTRDNTTHVFHLRNFNLTALSSFFSDCRKLIETHVVVPTTISCNNVVFFFFIIISIPLTFMFCGGWDKKWSRTVGRTVNHYRRNRFEISCHQSREFLVGKKSETDKSRDRCYGCEGKHKQSRAVLKGMMGRGG